LPPGSQLLAVQDRSPEVRLSAAAELNSLAQGAPGGAREIAREGLNRARILEELRRKHLLEKLREASGYLGPECGRTGSAISLYLSVWKDLSESARRNLDPSLLRKAESALKYGAMETAARSYQAMFEPFPGGAGHGRNGRAAKEIEKGDSSCDRYVKQWQ